MKFSTENGEGYCAVCDDPTDIHEKDTGAWICARCIKEISTDGKLFLRDSRKKYPHS